jgi:Skp family chaperone for outer membrane proteins
MKIFLRTLLSAALLLAFTSLPALAQSKIATVDLKNLFDNYYKTKLATATIQQRASELDKTYADMAADFKKHSDDYQTLLESANDQAVSQDERDRRRLSAQEEAKRLEDEKAAVEQFERQAQVQIADQRDRMRQNILTEIKKAVADKAKAAGDTMVFDTAAQSVNGTPDIIYSAGDNDMTDDVLKQLNSSAPPDLPDISTTPPVLLSTNSLPYTDMPGSQPVPAGGTP